MSDLSVAKLPYGQFHDFVRTLSRADLLSLKADVDGRIQDIKRSLAENAFDDVADRQRAESAQGMYGKKSQLLQQLLSETRGGTIGKQGGNSNKPWTLMSFLDASEDGFMPQYKVSRRPVAEVLTDMIQTHGEYTPILLAQVPFTEEQAASVPESWII